MQAIRRDSPVGAQQGKSVVLFGAWCQMSHSYQLGLLQIAGLSVLMPKNRVP
jgi:hypothetical protein